MNITAEQILTSFAATLAFIPVTLCPGYLAAWLTNLHGFRRRSLVERLCWSIPLSIAVSTITSVLVSRFASLTAATALILLCTAGCVAVLLQEHLHLRRSSQKWLIGLRPLGATIVILALCFIAFEIFSLVDFQRGQCLYLSLTFYDIAPRTNWANSVLRTGVPPANPHYFYLHPANLRYYYFWLVNCAVVAKFSRLPMRSIVNAGCIWSGFALTALTGLYLKHFLSVGAHLRRQFYIAALLPAVAGFSFLIFLWNMIVLHIPPPGDVWYAGQIADLVSFPLFYPHHLIGMTLCMFAFLLAWIAPTRSHTESSTRDISRSRIPTVLFIALAIASAFGISVYTTFAFFLICLCWATWQVIRHSFRSPLILLAGGALSLLLLLPYLYEITHSPSKMAAAASTGPASSSSPASSSPFVPSIRETIPPDRLARLLHPSNPASARALAKLILLPAGFALELGLYTIVLVLFLLRRRQLKPPHRTLLFIALVTLPITSFIRSAVLDVNDFGIHSALFLQYPLLLLASELLIAIKLSRPTATPASASPTPAATLETTRALAPRRTATSQAMRDTAPSSAATFETTTAPTPKLTQASPATHEAAKASGLILPPPLLRSLITLAILIGILSSCWRAAVLRFLLPIADISASAASNPQVAELPHKAFIAYNGYRQLNSRIPPDAVVQFNPGGEWMFWKNIDLANVGHQTVTVSHHLWCGAELGGDPSGCPAIVRSVVPLFDYASAAQARAACKQFRIHYLVAYSYDAPWNDRGSWVWNLPAVVSDPDFRALDCR
ncbi:hypothetical protein [Occallatibacter savannae]|uniref:hypothetical protein n=1 Tax=Occallatibacter savannae TaxID=1002691 RepID=UPI000D69872B|nr:hypothetical protein [Occallatibacter savannae]